MQSYIAPDIALGIVLQNTPSAKQTIRVEIDQAVGFVLAEPVVADRPYPPFNRSAMDGYAVKIADAGKSVEILGEIAAGEHCTREVSPGYAFSIMTGAACPPGTEAVVKIEDVHLEGNKVRLPEKIILGKNVVSKGSECPEGRSVLEPKAEICPLAIGMMASFGLPNILVYAPPRLALITTGNELVDIQKRPLDVQIRDSNGPTLAALARQAGISRIQRIHAADTLDSLAQTLAEADEADILIMTGGVSMGRYDLVPQAMADSGAEIHFHRVTQKPGKPLLFATRKSQLLFGLPGNPLSAHLGFARYIVPAIRKIMGHEPPAFPPQRGYLAQALAASSNRTQFILATAFRDGESWRLNPLAGKGSADLFSSPSANAYIRLESGRHHLTADAPVT